METLATEYTVRRLRAEDAEGVVDCVRRVYGDSYIIHTELYHPEEIVALNEAGRLVSVVALDDGGEIVGHYALERPDPSFRIAESGEAMVLLEEEAGRLGLTGIFGRTVTNHLFSQKMVERFGERPCGVSLGRTPRTFRNMREALSQRMSVVFYFKYLGTVDAVRIHVPSRHHEMCRQIYEQFQVQLDLATSQSVPESGDFVVDHHAELKRANILVRRFTKSSPFTANCAAANKSRSFISSCR
jgi:pimeloyl-ACP methyl ester carboxylesterase